jgi:hypothetical protein
VVYYDTVEGVRTAVAGTGCDVPAAAAVGGVEELDVLLADIWGAGSVVTPADVAGAEAAVATEIGYGVVAGVAGAAAV